MIDMVKVGKRIASMRKERGYTGEQLAERLQVSAQAVSKWENAKCLPETAILPALAEALQCSIDSLLSPRELFILEAVYTDGQTQIPVTHFVDDLVRGNALNIYVNEMFLGVSIKSDRLKLLTVKYQSPKGVFFCYALQNENLILNKESTDYAGEKAFELTGAYYGNEQTYACVMNKMEHYAYFKWDQIAVNHELFPSNAVSDDTEYLTLVYLNADGIHVISCSENGVIYYGSHRTQLMLREHSKCILKNVMRLNWAEGMDCPWAGALYAALKYMGEAYTYHQLMGMSGACYRICFVDVWDYSCTDALVAFDYVTPLSRAVGYPFHMAERLEKKDRKAERQAIMKDIRNGRPVLAINLRVAPEWGVITGYTDNGNRFLCRTYFDREIFEELEQEDHANAEDRRIVFEENEGYLYNDAWPFLIMHLGEKGDALPPKEVLTNSLATLMASFRAGECRGYTQGKGAYEAWIRGLSAESDFELDGDREAVMRRLSVNDSMLCNLADARKAAAVYLRENDSLLAHQEREYLEQIAGNEQAIADLVSAFQDRVRSLSADAVSYNTVSAFGAAAPQLRREQIDMLERALVLEEENCRLAELILK